MNIENLELHDALIHGAEMNYSNRRISILLDTYETTSSKERVRIELIFDEVDSVSHIADFNSLKKNKFAGNVNYWIPGNTDSPTYIYFTDGVMAITSKVPPRISREAD